MKNDYLIACRSKVEGGDDAVRGEPALVDLLAMLAVVEEPTEGHGRGVRVNLKKIHCLITGFAGIRLSSVRSGSNRCY